MIAPGSKPVPFVFNKTTRENVLNYKFEWKTRGLSEFTYYRTYARRKQNGTLETFNDCVLRVVEGMFTILKTHCKRSNLFWDEKKSQKLAFEAAERMFQFKWLPPGRGLWMMGTDFVWDRGGACLQNCAFVSTQFMFKHDPDETVMPFRFLMDMSMLGVGVGFDTLGAKNDVPIVGYSEETETFVVEDTRESWVDAVVHVIRNGIFGGPRVVLDVSKVRGEGEPIKGFGGVASGPAPLVMSAVGIADLIAHKAGKTIDSVLITDICNLIGKCVVAGNVRRCLPANTMVHTTTGIKPIETVCIGDEVMTSNGTDAVTDVVYQGKQQITKIYHQAGIFECTAKHRMAVLDSPTSYIWKRADELVSGDRLVFVNSSVAGTETKLPEFTYQTQGTTNIVPTYPSLDTEIAWIFGLFHGDGHVNLSKKQRGSNGVISFAVHEEQQNIIDRVVNIFTDRFGVHVSIVKSTDKAVRLLISNRELATFFSQFKTSKTSMAIPDFIVNGTVDIRAAYLAGLFDADRSSRTRPLCAVTTTYPDFAKQIHVLYGSIGIAARMRNAARAKSTPNHWKLRTNIDIVDEFTVLKWKDVVGKHSLKYASINETSISRNSYTYPAEWVRDDGELAYYKLWNANSQRMVYNTFLRSGGSSDLIPVEVLEIEHNTGEKETWDISVANKHEFKADIGILTHNTAEIAFGEVGDSDFANMKNWSMFPVETGSVGPDELRAVSEEDYSAYNAHMFTPHDGISKQIALKYIDEPWHYKFGGWRWSSNNSVKAKVGMDYSIYEKSIGEAGEPGFMWLDRMQTHGRLRDPANHKDARVMGGNPCVTRETLIHTSEGFKTVGDLLGTPFKAIVEGKQYNSTDVGFWSNGMKPVFKLMLDNGQSVRLTEDHKVLTTEGWFPAKEAIGKNVMVSPHATDASIDDSHEENVGYVAGQLIGDGTFAPVSYGHAPIVSVWLPKGTDVSEYGPVKKMTAFFREHEYACEFVHIGWHSRGAVDKYSARIRKELSQNLCDRGIRPVEKKVPETQSMSFNKGMLRGLFDSDGTVFGDSKGGGVMVRISQVRLYRLESIQRLLLGFGIKSRIYKKLGNNKQTLMPDGKGSKRLYDVAPAYTLNISGVDLHRFQDVIGFVDDTKKERLTALLGAKTKKPYRKPNYSKAIALAADGDEEVFDCTIETVHRFVANGIVVHNCLEQSLESYELCCLVENFPSHATDYWDFQRSLKFSYLYAKAVTLMATHFDRTNGVMIRNRRIGCSMSGIQDAIDRFGRTEFFTNWCENGYHYIQYLDKKYSEWLGVPMSVKTTSVKPSGTVSLVAGVFGPGLHYPKMRSGYRLIRISNTSELLPILANANYRIEPSVTDSQHTSVVYFPWLTPEKLKSEDDVTIWEQFKVAADLQYFWADNQVSCTVGFTQKEAETGQISACLEAFDGQLKGISLLPKTEGVYKQMPFTKAPREEVVAYTDQLLPLNFSHLTVEGENAASNKFCDGDACVI